MRVIDTTNPVNWNHHLNHGLLGWWMDLRRMTPVNRLWDITRPGVGGYEGTLTDMAVPGTSTSGWGASRVTNGFRELRFDGSNDRVDLGRYFTNSVGSLVLIFTKTITGDGLTVFAAQDGFGGGQMGLGWQGPYWYVSATATPILTSSALLSNTTYHLVGTWNGTEIVSYVNGIYQSSYTSAATPSNTVGYFFNLGCFHYSGGELFFAGGRYHSFSAYNRALNEKEALSHYREWKQGFPNLLNHASNRRYVRVAAGGGSSALLLRLQAEGLFAGYGGSL